MADEELVKHCMCGCMYLEAECPNCNKVTDADRIEALTEQLEAARADAKEAEAYAEELEAMNKNQEAMIRQADRRGDALEAKLAKAVDWFETIRDRAKGDYMAHTYYLDALAALTTIKRREP
jgi:methionyl-tRNA synthetase